jgi:hypothetical protein
MDEKELQKLLDLVEEAARGKAKNTPHTPPKKRPDFSPVISKFIEEFDLTAGPYKVKNSVLRYLYKDVFLPKFPLIMRLKDRHFFQLLAQRLPKGKYDSTRYYLLNHPFKEEHEMCKKKKATNA